MFKELVYSGIKNGTLIFLDDKDKPVLLVELLEGDFPIVINSKKRIKRVLSNYGITIKDIKDMPQINTSGETSVYFSEDF